MKRVLTLVVLVLALSVSLAMPVLAAVPLCSCSYCEGALASKCKTGNGTKISCELYLQFAACPIFP